MQRAPCRVPGVWCARTALPIAVLVAVVSLGAGVPGPASGVRSAGDHQSAARLASLPRLVLWAWERPTNLASVPPDVGVAYLAGTLVLSGDQVDPRPRYQPLVIPSGNRVIAVVRIEASGKRRPSLTVAQADEAIQETLRLVNRPRVAALQIDFDATPGQRHFYSVMIERLRRKIPSDWPLSITALASWCLGDTWIRDLPIDEAIPMLFRMGRDGRSIRERLGAGQDFSLAVCRTSVGVSLDETVAQLPAGRRRYVFDAGGWNQRAIAQAVRLREK